MIDPNIFDPDHDWVNEEEETYMDEIKCTVCKGTFLVPEDEEPEECPLCGEVFADGEL